jgi:hypothetical protein
MVDEPYVGANGGNRPGHQCWVTTPRPAAGGEMPASRPVARQECNSKQMVG